MGPAAGRHGSGCLLCRLPRCAALRPQGRQSMHVRGFLQHAPDLSLAFLHRAGPHGRKYDPRQDGARPFSHVMLQPR